jgi:hypothetical protein
MSEDSPTHADHQVFLDAIAAKRKLSVKYFNRKEKREREQVCAALDFGPLRGGEANVAYYQLWDLQARRKPLNRAVLPADIVSITPLDETFDPADIITWTFKPGAWAIARDWGQFS